MVMVTRAGQRLRFEIAFDSTLLHQVGDFLRLRRIVEIKADKALSRRGLQFSHAALIAGIVAHDEHELRRRMQGLAYTRRPKRFLHVTLPTMH